MTIRLTQLQMAKSLSCLFFAGMALASLIETLIRDPKYYLRDLIILSVMALPMLFNRKIVYLVFGLMAALFSMTGFLIFLGTQNPWLTEISTGSFLLGCTVCSAAVLASFGMLYVGTYSTEKNRFTLI